MSTSKTSKLSMFTDILSKQEPPRETTPEPIPAPDPVTTAPEKKKKYPPMTVYVPLEQREIIAEIAAATGQPKHAVLQYAVRKVCNEWKKGKFPEMEVKPKFK